MKPDQQPIPPSQLPTDPNAIYPPPNPTRLNISSALSPKLSTTEQVLNTHVDGKRVAAGIVDLVLVFVLLSLTDQGGFINFKFGSGGYSVTAGPIVSLWGTKGTITTIVIALYFILFETFKGGTIGKLAAGIKVVREDGSRITFNQALIRNLLRIVDGFPYFIPYLLGMIVMATSPRRQRIGDKLAKTLVIKE